MNACTTAAGLNSDLGPSVGDISPHHRIGHRHRGFLAREVVHNPQLRTRFSANSVHTPAALRSIMKQSTVFVVLL
jgi:hypothetical protein